MHTLQKNTSALGYYRWGHRHRELFNKHVRDLRGLESLEKREPPGCFLTAIFLLPSVFTPPRSNPLDEEDTWSQENTLDAWAKAKAERWASDDARARDSCTTAALYVLTSR